MRLHYVNSSTVNSPEEISELSPGEGLDFTLIILSVNVLKLFSGRTNSLVLRTPGLLEAAWAMQAIGEIEASQSAPQ